MSETQENKVSIELSGEMFDFIKINTTAQISNTNFQGFDWPLRESSEKFLEMVGNPGSEMVRMIMDLEGIVSVSIKRYRIFVTIGNLFNKEEIAENLVQIVEIYLKPKSIIGATWREKSSTIKVENK